MKTRSTLAAASLTVTFAGAFAASCGAPPVAPRATTPSTAKPAIANTPPAEVSTPRPRRPHAPPPPDAPPPPRVTMAMPGEPPPARLAEARLVATSCEKETAEANEAEVLAMKKEIRESFLSWHAEQPECWRQNREAARIREMGVGEGIGLGSIGTIGHGSGFGLGLTGTGAGGGGGEAVGHLWGEHKSETARKVSGTNNQVASVDEADIVKTDGRYVYFAANGALRIANAMSPHMLSSTPVPGEVRNLFVAGDRAVVYTSSPGAKPPCTYAYDCNFTGDGSRTTITVLDVKDRTKPSVVRSLELSGSLVAARRIGSTVHTVVADGDDPAAPAEYETWPADLETCGTPEAVVRAKFAKLERENEKKIRARKDVVKFPTLRDGGSEQPLCNGMLRTAITDGKAFTSVVSFDLESDKTAPSTATIRSRPGAVFASADALYVAVAHEQGAGSRWYSWQTSTKEVTELHKFRIGARAETTKYVGSGTVPGHVLNQFAMDEWYGYLRVATTRGRVPDPKVSSVVSILVEGEGGNLVRVGAIDKIAPGEDIRAVRFEGERGYVVTFKKTDPLFVMDLGHPARPRILGELKIPGFSTYMHRIDRDHLLSIGFDANDHGDFAYFDGVILQLFDVVDPTKPKLIHKEKIGTRGSSSEAATNHLAFNYFREEGLLAIPMTVCEGGGDGRNGSRVGFSGLLVYDVDPERGFTRLGGVDHHDAREAVSCGTWWTKGASAVKRSIFLDDLVYSVAGDRAKVQRISALGRDLADLSLMP